MQTSKSDLENTAALPAQERSLREWSRTSNDFANAWYVYCTCGRAHWIGLPLALPFDIELKDAGYSDTMHAPQRSYSCKCGRAIEYASHNAGQVEAHEVMTDAQRCAAYCFMVLFIVLFIVLMVRFF